MQPQCVDMPLLCAVHVYARIRCARTHAGLTISSTSTAASDGGQSRVGGVPAQMWPVPVRGAIPARPWVSPGADAQSWRRGGSVPAQMWANLHDVARARPRGKVQRSPPRSVFHRQVRMVLRRDSVGVRDAETKGHGDTSSRCATIRGRFLQHAKCIAVLPLSPSCE
jgi:hypothetical protein